MVKVKEDNFTEWPAMTTVGVESEGIVESEEKKGKKDEGGDWRN
ncbi:hypothetical protein FVER14953_20901 [Fusarium verticillioides]|jgi:hypothetical protein|nr:hypothetical protein FVER14953_20901 [Fusarium verticillioides]